MPQPLSSKESSLFRTVVRNYEDKQYKKGELYAGILTPPLLTIHRVEICGSDPEKEP